jgi:hypothetical protein
MEIKILHKGIDIAPDVLFADAIFQGIANGRPGPCSFRVKDVTHVYEPGYFHVGDTLQLLIDGTVEWDGWVMTVGRNYAFDVDDTTRPDPIATPRFWVIGGMDRNLLFTRRAIFNQDKPADPAGVPTFQPGTTDKVALTQMMNDFIGLAGDDIDITSGVVEIGTPGAWEIFKLGTIGGYWGEMMDDLSGQTGAIYFIRPDRVFVYADDLTVTAPYKLTDVPRGAGDVGYRELEVRSDGMSGPLTTEAFVWGIGKGSADPVFYRENDDEAVAKYGIWQWGDTYPSSSKLTTVTHRAQTFLYGSPTHHRGHNKPQDFVFATVFKQGFRCGQVVDLESLTFGWEDNVPIRSATITFPTTTSAKWVLELSHSIDVPFAAVDPWPDEQPSPYPGGTGTPPTPGTVTTGTDFTPDWWALEVKDDGDWLLKDGVVMNWSRPPIYGITHDPAGINMALIESVYNNVPWPYTFFGIGAGGWVGNWYNEIWWRLGKSNELVGKTLKVPIRSMVPSGHGDLWCIAGAQKLPRDPRNDRSVEVNSLHDVFNWTPIQYMGMFEIWRVILPYEVTITPAYTQASPFDDDTWDCYLVIAPLWWADTPRYPDTMLPPVGWQFPWQSGKGGSALAAIDDRDSLLHYTWESGKEGTPGTPGTPGTMPSAGTAVSTNMWQTEYPYVPGTLEVFINGLRLKPGIDFQETNPSNGIFTILGAIPVGGSVTVRYRASSLTHTTRPSSGGTSGGGAPPPGPPPPQGTVYRPRHLSQFGWHSAGDSYNCNMASSAMLLERDSMGANSPTSGYPRNTPPNMRLYSGTSPTSATGPPDALRAWQNGWGKSFFWPSGWRSWDNFLGWLNQGRGASMAGHYWILDANYHYLKSSNFEGDHQLYVNEQLPNGDFVVDDPLASGAAVWPYEAVKLYYLSRGPGYYQAYYSRITPSV